jgi:hypothetical protein
MQQAGGGVGERRQSRADPRMRRENRANIPGGTAGSPKDSS